MNNYGPLEVVTYIYGGKHATNQLEDFRCVRCGRIVFKHNSNRMELTNIFGVSAQTLTRGEKDKDGVPVFTEHKCHSCKTVYKILFQ